MSTFLEWVRVQINNRSLTMLNFVDWLSSKGREEVFWVSFVPFLLLSAYCMHCVYLGVPSF